MANFYPPQSASRVIKHNNVLYAGGLAAVISTQLSAQTRQIRVATNISGGIYFSVTDSSAATITAPTGGAFVAANNFPEYFTTTPGQVVCINSTSTTTGVISITECLKLVAVSHCALISAIPCSRALKGFAASSI
jgi:hypothetical protein